MDIIRGNRNVRRMGLLTRLVYKIPGVKTQLHVDIVFAIIILACIAVIVYSFHPSIFSQSNKQTYIEDLTPQQRQELPPALLKTLPSRTSR